MGRFFVAWTETVLRGRWLLLAAVALLTVVFARQLPGLELDNSNEQWLMEGDASLARLQKFTRLFGNDDFVYVLYETDDFFRPEPIERMRALAGALEETPHLLDLTWLGNAERVEGRADGIEIEPLIEVTPREPEALAEIRRRALAEPAYVDDLISRDGSAAGVLLEMDAYPTDRVDPRKDIAPAVRAVLARPEHADLGLVAVGGPLLDHDLDVVTAQEGRRLGLYCLLVQVAILLWVGRGLRGVLVPVLVVMASVVWTFGAVALLGFKLNFSVIMVPVLLICVGIGDSMHVIAEFQDERRRGARRREALRAAMASVGWPCALTTLTTSLGFLSFLATRLRPFQEMGRYAALGVCAALLLSFVLVPILYSFGRETPAAGSRGAPREDVFDRALRGAARLVARRPGWIVAAFALLLVLAGTGYSRLRIETNPLEMFGEEVPIRQAFEHVDARMGGSMSVEIMLDTGERDGVLEPGFLARMDALDRAARELPETTKTTSVLDVLRQMRRAFHENRPEFYDIPATREEAAQYLLVYEMSGGENLAKLVPFERDLARLTVRTRSLGTTETKAFVDALGARADEIFAGSARAEFTGVLSWARAMNDLVALGQRQSFGAAFVSISLLMMLVLRSVRLGLISMIPNVFPVLATLGLLGATGRPLDMVLMVVSALIIGVAVDDTIHFFVRYRREFTRLGRYAPALEATLTSVGRPITFTTLTLSLGFGVLGASQMAGVAGFGLMSAFAFTWALLADFFFAPALLLLLRPLGPERAAAAPV